MNTAEALPFDAPLSAHQQQAETLFTALQSGDEAAQWRFKWMHPRFKGKHVDEVKAAILTLDDAKLLIAREYYFDDWPALAAFTEAVHTDGPIRRFEQAVEAVISGEVATLGSLLQSHPDLVHARSTRCHHATLLHYIGANGVEGERQKTPPNAVAVAKMLLEGGAEPDALADMYDNQCTTMSLLVSSCHPDEAGLQIALAETLLDHGAVLNGPGTNWSSSVLTALQFGYLKTAEALVRRGAAVDNLVIAAGLGLVEDVVRLLPSADSLARHQALALAAQHGHVGTTKLLLDAGEDPSRINPDGFHSHSTPLHQAVWADHLEVVKLLVERGARLDIRDTVYDGTPLDWAEHGKRTIIAYYLRGVAASRDNLQQLIDQLQHPDWHEVGKAIQALGNSGDRRAVEPLLGLLDRPLVYGDAVGALVKLGDERALEPMIQLFERKPQPDFATVLGNWGDRRAVPALIAAMQNPDQHVRYYTARALGKLGDERALPVLRHAVESDTEKFTDTETLRNKSVAIAAAKAIEAIEGGG